MKYKKGQMSNRNKRERNKKSGERYGGEENRYRLTNPEIQIIEEFREMRRKPEFRLSVDRETKKLKSKIMELHRQYRAALEELETYEARSELIEALASSEPPGVLTPSKKAVKGSESIAFSVCSDWHIEEEVDLKAVNELNEYTLDIARQRAERFFEKTVYLLELLSNRTKIKTLVLPLLGDFLSGYIHEELLETNQCTPPEAVMYLYDMLSSGIKYLEKQTKLQEIIVPCCVGNHGRTTRKLTFKNRCKNSYEYLLYAFISRVFEDSDKVRVQIPFGYHTYFNAFDKYLIRFHHGNDIKYRGGVGGITIPVNKAIAQWNKTKKVYLDVFGHFHQSKSDAHWVSNGSLIGYSEYALSIKADYEPPQQTFFTIEKNKGKTFTAPIFVKGE